MEQCVKQVAQRAGVNTTVGSMAEEPSTFRVGGIIILVGVGSFICWKLWKHWRKEVGGPTTPPPTPTATPPARRPQGILTSLPEEYLVQDPNEFEDEDPAFIQDDTMPSLEWDYDGLQQYAEDARPVQDDPHEVFPSNSYNSRQLLSDDASLELNLEEELMFSSGPLADDYSGLPDLHKASHSTSFGSLPPDMGNSLPRYAPRMSFYKLTVSDSYNESDTHWEPLLISTPKKRGDITTSMSMTLMNRQINGSKLSF
ncbi:uncharacterized protein [Procambarus clarkii]|uniref:uncharacterized protein n=1 Tax=Procambarus clarkii TaxID=6728 RepID=UPI00374311E5